MIVTHRTREGDWGICDAPGNCELRFHFPDTTPELMAAVPLLVLIPMLELLDPPNRVSTRGDKRWTVAGVKVLHRDYDLPALITADGDMVWYQLGRRHRGRDEPASIAANGSRTWWYVGMRHRDRGPAFIHGETGAREWWRNDRHLDAPL